MMMIIMMMMMMNNDLIELTLRICRSVRSFENIIY